MPAPLSDTHIGVAGPAEMPQGFCKLGSMTAAPWSVRFDTRLVWVNAVLPAPAPAPMAERLRSPVARAIAGVNRLSRMPCLLASRWRARKSPFKACTGGRYARRVNLLPLSKALLSRASSRSASIVGSASREGVVADEGRALGRATGSRAGGDYHRDRSGRGRALAIAIRERIEELRPGFRRQVGRHSAPEFDPNQRRLEAGGAANRRPDAEGRQDHPAAGGRHEGKDQRRPGPWPAWRFRDASRCLQGGSGPDAGAGHR